MGLHCSPSIMWEEVPTLNCKAECQQICFLLLFCFFIRAPCHKPSNDFLRDQLMYSAQEAF